MCNRNNREYTYFGFLVNNNEIVPLYDTPHLFKEIRNNLLNKELHFELNNTKMIAKWDHVEQFYYLDISEEERICPKITSQHVVRGSINKMKVSCCTQIFSHQVGSLMKRIAQWDVKAEHKLPPDAVDTAELLLFLDQLFDSLNSNNRISFASKPLKSAVRKHSGHIQFWRNAIRVLSTMKFFCNEKKKFIVVPSIKNLCWTLQGFIYITNIILEEYKFSYICTRAFNQDALENFFSYIRSHGARHSSPEVSHFVSSFKALLTTNFLSSHSPNSNCEEDSCLGALTSLKHFLTYENIGPVDSHDVIEVTVPTVARKRTKIGRCTLVYITGFLAKKIFKFVKCNACSANLQSWNELLDTEFIESRQYQHSKLTKPGSFLYFLVSQSLSRLYYLIPRYCHLHKISCKFQKILLQEINFRPLNCPNHNISNTVCKTIIKCALYFWCKHVNRIAKGRDLKFKKYLDRHPENIIIADPIKVSASQKYAKKLVLKRRLLKC